MHVHMNLALLISTNQKHIFQVSTTFSATIPANSHTLGVSLTPVGGKL